MLFKSDASHLEEGLFQKDFLIKNFNRLKIKIGDRVFHNTIIAQKGWFEYTGEGNLDDWQNLTGTRPSELQQIEQKLAKLNQQLKQQGIPLVVVVAPNKASIYPETIPPVIQKIAGPSRLDAFSQLMSQHPDIIYLDLRATLLAAKHEQTLYYATDTHWNPHGAYAGYAAILTRLAEIYPDLQPYRKKQFNIKEMPAAPKDLAQIMGAPFWVEPTLTVKPRLQVDVFSRTLSTSSGFSITESWSAPAPQDLTLLLYGDSFKYGMIPFLETHFKKSVFTSYHETIHMAGITRYQPDIVILEVVERYLPILNSVLTEE
ncbi:MAG: hypothetical protein HXY38_01850 [Chloroflexi bacterium]|nr:hypothetical protein [Chloroflexota bacterium]